MKPPAPPERRGLRFDQWPETDRLAWQTAMANGDVFDGKGPAAHWAAATRKTNILNYGRWLGFLEYRGHFVADRLPEERVTSTEVKGYTRHLMEIVAPQTVVTLLVGLKVTIKAMAPHSDWQWLAELCNALDRSAEPSRDKRSRMRPVQEIYMKSLEELDRLQGLGLTGRNRLCAYRDSLMLAMLASRPLRRKNFVGLELGRHLVRDVQGWHLIIPGKEVKNGQTLEYDLVAGLEPYLETYLERVRPQMMGSAHQSSRLWISWGGSDCATQSIYNAIMKQTKRLLGVSINPHLFRDCAATSLSTVSPTAARAAAPLLGHRFFATTERYYIRANQLQAGRTINATLASIKADLK